MSSPSPCPWETPKVIREARRPCSERSVIVQNFAGKTAAFCRLAPLSADLLHYLPTPSTIFRHQPPFADMLHYLPTKSSFFADKSASRAYVRIPPKRFIFPFGTPHPDPPPDVRSSVQIGQPGGLSAVPAGPQPRPAKLEMVYYLPTKGSLFADIVYYWFLTKWMS
jgi:hypothetical protein